MIPNGRYARSGKRGIDFPPSMSETMCYHLCLDDAKRRVSGRLADPAKLFRPDPSKTAPGTSCATRPYGFCTYACNTVQEDTHVATIRNPGPCRCIVSGHRRRKGTGPGGRMEETDRPATTSIYGDTGLWFVPTGEVLRDKTWSASGYRVNWDVRQGFTDISHFEGTFAYRCGQPGGNLWRRAVRHPNRSRHAADLRLRRRSVRRRRQQLPVCAPGMDR